MALSEASSVFIFQHALKQKVIFQIMINHLKKIHSELYLPQALDSARPTFKITPINEPYLYTDADRYVDTFDNPNQSVKVNVSNVGAGTLQVDQIQIPRAYGKWVKRGEKVTPAALTATSEPLEIELKLVLKELPNPVTVNVAELNLISNSKKKTFSKVLLGVRPPESESRYVTGPEYINFGEITVWNVSLTNSRKDETEQTAGFSLVGNFRFNPLQRLEITQTDESRFDAHFLLREGELHYELDLRAPGVVMPQQKKAGLKLKAFQQTVSIANVNQHKLSKAIKSDTEWLIALSEISVDGYETINFPIFVNIEKLKQGRNFGELIVSDKRIPVWAWYKVIGETALTLNQEQSNIHHIEEFPAQGKSLPIEVVSENESRPSFMIFEDVDFQFPLTAEDRTGYLIGDFNQWTPRTLLLDKRNDNFGATLSISDGTYLFRAEIDGEMRLDPNHLYEIVCCSHGLASRMQIGKREQKITLQNKSRRRFKLRIQSPTEWIQVDSDAMQLSANGQRDVPIILLPQVLQPGLNLGWLEMETSGESKRSFRTPIFVMGTTSGAVPILQNSEIEFPKFEQEKTVEIPLALNIFGKGELKGEIQPSTVLRFAEGDLRVQSETAYESTEVAPLIHVLSDKPSNAYRKQCNAWLVTDCYLANRRLLPFTAKYNMTHLISDPSALYFPKVFLFDTPQYTDLIVKHSDNSEAIACAVEIPEELAQTGLLNIKNTTHKNSADPCKFVLDPQAVTAGGHFTGNLRLKDEKTGMTLPIKFGANIIGSHADIQIGNATRRSRQLEGIPAVIANVGETEMKIFEVRFKEGNFYCTPSLSLNLTLLAGESLNFQIKARRRTQLFRKIEDTIIIKLNDSQFKQGIFEKKITAEIRGIF